MQLLLLALLRCQRLLLPCQPAFRCLLAALMWGWVRSGGVSWRAREEAAGLATFFAQALARSPSLASIHLRPLPPRSNGITALGVADGVYSWREEGIDAGMFRCAAAKWRAGEGVPACCGFGPSVAILDVPSWHHPFSLQVEVGKVCSPPNPPQPFPAAAA